MHTTVDCWGSDRAVRTGWFSDAHWLRCACNAMIIEGSSKAGYVWKWMIEIRGHASLRTFNAKKPMFSIISVYSTFPNLSIFYDVILFNLSISVANWSDSNNFKHHVNLIVGKCFTYIVCIINLRLYMFLFLMCGENGNYKWYNWNGDSDTSRNWRVSAVDRRGSWYTKVWRGAAELQRLSPPAGTLSSSWNVA